MTPIDIRACAKTHALRCVLPEWAGSEPREEKSWLWEIPCRRGKISAHSHTHLIAYAKTGRAGNELRALGFTSQQAGDTESSFLFHPDYLPAVANVLGARRRRVMSEEARRAAGERLAKVRPQNRAG
jgi:hypothetical protein